MDLRPPLAPLFATFGLAAVIHPDDAEEGEPDIVTTVIWAQRRPTLEGLASLQPAPVASREEHKTLAVRKAAVPSLPTGSTITTPLIAGATPQVWIVDRVDASDPELWFVGVGLT